MQKNTKKKGNSVGLVILLLISMLVILYLILNNIISKKSVIDKQNQEVLSNNQEVSTSSNVPTEGMSEEYNKPVDIEWETPDDTTITPGIKVIVEKATNTIKYEPIAVVGIKDNPTDTYYRVLCKRENNEYVLVDIYLSNTHKSNIISVSKFNGNVKKYTK